MDVVVNPDGTSTITCEGTSITIGGSQGNGSASKPGKLSDPGTVQAFLATSHNLGAFSHLDGILGSLAENRSLLRDMPEASRNTLILHVSHSITIDVARIRRMLDEQGLSHVQIELIPEPHNG